MKKSPTIVKDNKVQDIQKFLVAQIEKNTNIYLTNSFKS